MIKTKKILVVFGTRPEAIKMCPLIIELQKNQKDFEVIVAVTGQHREMLDQVLSLFKIVPQFDLNLMQHGQDLYDITSRVLLGMRGILDEIKPDLILVHGDTTTCFATSLAAFYKRIPVGHVEAGLRTNNIYSPWPEELNRQITGKIAKFHFAPTLSCSQNLLDERVSSNQVFVTGNTVIDALMMVNTFVNTDVNTEKSIKETFTNNGIDLKKIISKKMVLITGHRRENFGDGFIQICESIKELATLFPDVNFVYPMHLNENVRKPIHQVFGDITTYDNMFFIEPLEYLEFVYLMGKCHLILTDSGGIQEEAPSLGKPVLVMRDSTERPEAVASGTVKLVGTNKIKIVSEVTSLLIDDKYYESMTKATNPYGDGKASQKIVEIIKQIL